MKLTYRLGETSPHLVVPVLQTQAAALGVQLEASESASADLYFYQTDEGLPRMTGIAQAIGAETLHESVATLMLGWAKERQELIKISPLRHELGNLIVILLGRIISLREENISTEHTVSLESLHQRLTSLYHDFDAIEVPRY
jgi:hypothetical protein